MSGLNIPTFDSSSMRPLDEFDDIDRRFKNAIQRSMAGTQTPAHDAVVLAYCSRDPWKTQPYCACVNAPFIFSNPQCSFGPCQTNTYAYVPTKLQGYASGEKPCPPTAICVQGLSIEDRRNIAQNVSQDQTCQVGGDPGNPGGPDVHNETKKNVPPPKDGILAQLTSNPMYIGAFVVLLVVIALIIAIASSGGGEGPAAAAPAAGLPPLPELPGQGS